MFAHASTIVKVSLIAVSVTGSFSLTKSNFSKTEVVKAKVYTIIDHVIDYWKERIEDQKGSQMTGMKEVRIFNPLHVFDNKISVSDMHWLTILKLYEHLEIRTQIEEMKIYFDTVGMIEFVHATSIHVRVVYSADQLTQVLSD
jgi:hypothetical protein